VVEPSGASFSFTVRLRWSLWVAAAIATLDRWAATGSRVEIVPRTDRRATPQLRVASGPTWMLLDLLPG
jgi:hypothetical protein